MTDPDHLHTLTDDEHRALEAAEASPNTDADDEGRLEEYGLIAYSMYVGNRITPAGQAIRDRVRRMAYLARRHGFCRWCFRPRPCFDMCETMDHGDNTPPDPPPLHRAVLRQWEADHG